MDNEASAVVTAILVYSRVLVRYKCLVMSSAKRKKYSLREVVRLIEESDEESFDDSDNDRDSNYDLSDDSHGTELYDPPATQSHVAATMSDDDSYNDPTPAAPSTSTSVPTVSTSTPATPTSNPATFTLASQALHDTWEPVDGNYNPNPGFTFSENPGIRCDSLTVDSLPVDFFKQFVTDEVIELLVTETN